ncbi:MAG: G8 domain-containing protein, partial [Pseudomonadota bacterium]
MTTETVVLWSDAETWLGFAPGNGDDVVVPRGLTVTLDADTPALGTLAVRGTLRASDEIDLRLTADNVLVFGALEIGTVDRPHTREFEIVLTGGAADPHIVLADWAGLRGRVIGSSAGPMTEPLPPKALIVAPGGRLDLHGADVRSWTRLEGTAPAGSTSIEVRDARGWMVGDTIAIAPTGLDAFEVEERVVTAIDGTVIGLDEPLTYAHFGMRQILPDGDLLDMRAEVANLSRNIAIQGEADPNESELTTGTGSEHADAFARTAHGGHVTVLGGAVARIAGAEFADLGISGTAGRHALWFQHGGDRAGSYVMSASIHHTFRGGIVVDRTDNLLIEENVVYDVMGHGIQLKEGGANGNRFDGNLVMMPRSTEDAFDPKASRTRPPGGAASGFQIDSGENAFAGNHVAGVPSGQGFQFGASDTSMEPASDGDPRVGEAKLLQFADNIAHTIMTDGEIVDRLDDDRGRSGVGLDIAAPLAPGSAPIEGFTAWMIGDAGVALPHKATAAFEDLLVADVRQAIRPAGTSVDIDGFTFVVASDNSPDGIDPKAIFVAGGLRGPMLGTFMAPSTVKGLRILRDDALAGTMDDAASLENLTLRPDAAGNGLTSLAGLPQVFPTTAQGEERDVRSTPSHGEDSVGTKGDDTVLDGGRRDAAWAFGDDEPSVDDMTADIPADRDEVARSPQDVEPGAAVRTVF